MRHTNDQGTEYKFLRMGRRNLTSLLPKEHTSCKKCGNNATTGKRSEEETWPLTPDDPRQNIDTPEKNWELKQFGAIPGRNECASKLDPREHTACMPMALTSQRSCHWPLPQAIPVLVAWSPRSAAVPSEALRSRGTVLHPPSNPDRTILRT